MKLRLRRPQTVIGFLYRRTSLFHGWVNMLWMLRVQPESLHIHYSLLNHWIIRWAHHKGLRINSYTINDKEAYSKVKSKTDGVFTDNIEYLK
jgi:glycerophosphoryl diester phosphodiesterase